MTPIQAVVIVFALVMAYVTYVGWRRRQFAMSSLGLWLSIWVCLALVSVAPDFFRWLIKPLRLARLMDLVVVGGMLVLGVITYRNYVIVQRLQRQLESFVREQALASVGQSDDNPRISASGAPTVKRP